jgi:hypothetical protein
MVACFVASAPSYRVTPVDKDPAAYVGQAEKGTRPGEDGSLGIGGLKHT